MTRKSYLSEYFLKKVGRCTKVSNSQPAPISGNVINQILYLEIPENNPKHVDKCCTEGLGTLKIWSLCCCTNVKTEEKKNYANVVVNCYYGLSCLGYSFICVKLQTVLVK